MKRLITRATASLSLMVASLFYGGPVLAQGESINLDVPAEWNNRVPQNITLQVFVSGIIQILLIAGAVFFFIYLIIGGIKWILSGGDKGQIEAARNQITHAIIGLLIVLGVWVINGILSSLFGIDILGNISLPKFNQ